MLIPFAQITGGDNISIVTLITQVGFSGIFLWMWYDATKERRASGKALTDLFERLLPVLEDATSTLERVQKGMEKQVERTERATPTLEEMTATIRRFEQLAADLETNRRSEKK